MRSCVRIAISANSIFIVLTIFGKVTNKYSVLPPNIGFINYIELVLMSSADKSTEISMRNIVNI